MIGDGSGPGPALASHWSDVTVLASDWPMVTRAQELSGTDGQCHRSWANDRGGNIRQKVLYLFGKHFEFQSQA